MTKELAGWIVADVLGLFVVGFCLWAYPQVDKETPNALLMALLLRVPIMVVGIAALIGSLMFLDFVTHEDWFELIAKNPLGCAYVATGLMLATALLVAFN